jgi:hypothetical protein
MDERVKQDIRGITTAPVTPAVAPGDVGDLRKRGRWLLWPLLGVGAALLLPLAVVVAFYWFAPVRAAPGDRQRPVPGAPVLDAAEVPGVFCKVHRAPLRTDLVPIEYGLIRPSEQQERARPKLFPWANERYPGGCEPKEPQTARVSYCASCREALAQWKRVNPGR